jgi:hypothetical protein
MAFTQELVDLRSVGTNHILTWLRRLDALRQALGVAA